MILKLVLKIVVVSLVCVLRNGIAQTYKDVKDALPERPHYGGVMGKYLNYPGLSYEPNVPSKKGLVYFIKARYSTYQPYVDHMDSILSKYGNVYMQTEDMIDCAVYSQYRPKEDWGKNCRFDLVVLGDNCVKQTAYGYEDGMPCFTLSLERILNWLPEPYTNETVPDKIRDEWSMYSITVHCEGEDPVSKDNIGTIKYYPSQGFDFKYFPNTGQKHWVSPLVAVQFENPMPAIALRVTCAVYAKNIQNEDKLSTGKVSFDLMVD